MAVFGGIFSRKDKKAAQDHSPSSGPASPVVGPPSPSTLKKSSPLPKSYNSVSPEPSRERSYRLPARPSFDANRMFADSREHRRDVDDDDATTTFEGGYVLPPIDSPSLMNGADRADYFSPSPSPPASKPLVKKPVASSSNNNGKSVALVLPSVNLSPIKLPLSVEEEEDERPLGLRAGKPYASRSTPPAQVIAASAAGPGKSQSPQRGHTRNASSLEEMLSLPTISTDVRASSIRSLPLNSPTSPVRQRPGIPTAMLSVPRSTSPAGSSTSHFPISPSSIGGSDSTRPTSPTSTRSKSTIPRFGAPLLKFSSRDPPPQLNAESESRSLTKAERAKSKEREKEKNSGGGMFSFMRDRKKSSANSPSSSASASGHSPSPATPATPAAGNNSRGSMELLGRISFSSSKSEGHLKTKEKDDTPPPPVPPLPPSATLDNMPPLRPIPVDRRPSIEMGFVPPVRRKYVPPKGQATTPTMPGASDAEEKDATIKQGSFELVSFRHVRPVSPGPAIGVGAVRATSPGPFQGLELTAGRNRSGSFASDTSASKTTVSAFRQAQQRRGTGLSSAASEGRRSTADLLEEAEARKSLDVGKKIDSLPLPGPPAPAPVELLEPVRPYAAIGGASPRGSLDGGSRPSTPPVRPPRTNPPPGVRGASPANLRDKLPTARGSTTPRKNVTQSAYGQLYSSTTSSDEEDSEDEESSDDNVPLGARGRSAGVKAKDDGVSRKKTITQKNAASTTSLVRNREDEDEDDSEDDARHSKRDTIIAPKQAQTSSHIRTPASSTIGRSPAQTPGGRSPGSASSTPAGKLPGSASSTPGGKLSGSAASSPGSRSPAATVPLGTPISRPHKVGVVVPPPRSSSLFVDTKRPASTAVLESTTSPTSTVTGHSRAQSASLLGGGLAGYAASKGSKSMGSVNLSSPSPTATAAKRPPMPKPKSRTRPLDSSTSDESESEKSSSDDDDDAPLGLLRRPGSSLSLRSQAQAEGWTTRSEVGHGVSNLGGRRPALKNPGSSSNSSGLANVPRPPPRDARRPPPPGPSFSLPNPTQSKSGPAKASPPARSMTNIPAQPNLPSSMFNQPPMRPFAGNAGRSSSFYASSPGGSSNGDSYGSSVRLPLTPRDGSELGTTSGSSQLGGKKEGSVAPTSTTTTSALASGKKPYHGRKSSVTFEELPIGNGRKSSEEEKRNERRREEAKAAIQMGNAINGPPPQLSDDETDLYTTQMRLSGMPNLGAAGAGAPGMNMAWDPQLLMMLQAQQAQMMAAAMNMNMGNDPNYMNAHQQALFYAKQAYQLTVAQQAMEAAGEEWERASNVNGPAGGSVSGASVLGGGLGGGMQPFMGMGNPGMMGMPMGMGMGMGMPMMNMGMGMGMPGMLFPPAPGSAYGGSTAGSVYGGGSRIRPNFTGSASVMGDHAPSEAAKSRKPRTRTNTAPSNAPLPVQHASRLPPPPSSWKK
ncbi:hypothetical protein FRB90_002907 [Tulasnella sp. 427]|nr:hypothetical protein FRB90_002907 [Tulasnella sp. 427]